MSDPTFYGISDRQLIQSIVAEMFFCDPAIVQNVKGSGAGQTVDVVLATLAVDLQDNQLDPQTIYGVEVLFPTGSGLSQSWTLKPGDIVILFGMRSLVPNTAQVTKANVPPEFWHYSPQTVKAVPMSSASKGAVQFGELNGKAFLRNQVGNLYTIINTMNQALATFTGAAAQSSITAGGASSASLAAAIVALMTAFQTATAQLATQIGGLLEA